MAFPSLLPGFVPTGSAADFMRRRTQTQAVRSSIGAATAGGGGLAGARAGSEAASQGVMDAGFQAAQMRQQEQNAEALRKQQYQNERSGLFRGLLSGVGSAIGATGSSEGSAGQQLMGVAGSLAPLLLASDRRLKAHIRTANPDEVMRIREMLLQRERQSAPQAGGMGQDVTPEGRRQMDQYHTPAPAPTPPSRGGMGDLRRSEGALSTMRATGQSGQAPAQDAAAAGLAARTQGAGQRPPMTFAREERARQRPARSAAIQQGIQDERMHDPAALESLEAQDVQAARALGRARPTTFRGPNGPVGVIAQEVRAAAPGMVQQSQSGVNGIPVGQGLSVALAGQSDLERRMRALEARPGRPAAGGGSGAPRGAAGLRRARGARNGAR